MNRLLVIMAVGILLISCHKTQPQRPYVLGEVYEDTAMVQLLQINQRMVNAADQQLAKIATDGYVLMEENYWVKGLKEHIADTLKEEAFITLEAEIYDLDGRSISSHQADAQLGKVDEIAAIVSVLPHMQRGQSVSLLVPWYMAYGSAGNQDVMPYENIRVELTIK